MTNSASTSDYSIFKKVRGNRQVLPRHVKALAESIAKESFLPQHPIIVNEKMEVIDGQHRLAAAESIGEPVYYTILKGGDLSHVQVFNATAQNWRSTDYLNSYIEQGNPDYITLKEYVEKYEMPISTAIGLLDNRPRNDARFRTTMHEFRIGKFKITTKEWADRVGQFYKDISAYTEKKGARGQGLAEAVRAYMKTPLPVPHEKLLEKYEISGRLIPHYSLVIDYLRHFEATLNWKNRDENTIRIY